MKLLSLTLPGGNNIQPPSGIPSGGLEAGGAGQKLVQLGIDLIFTIGIILAIVFLIVAGIQWITSGGDKQKVQAARNRLIYSIIGLIVIAGAFFIISTIISLLGGNPNFFLKTQ